MLEISKDQRFRQKESKLSRYMIFLKKKQIFISNYFVYEGSFRKIYIFFEICFHSKKDISAVSKTSAPSF